MLEPEGRIVQKYRSERGTVIKICDAAYAGKTEEELECIRREMRRIACDIVRRAAERGVDV